MDLNITPDQLKTVGVLAVFITLTVQLLVKPILKARNTPPDIYPIIVNGVSLVIALLFSSLALFASTSFARVDVVQAIVTSLAATFISTGVYEMQDNAKRMVGQ